MNGLAWARAREPQLGGSIALIGETLSDVREVMIEGPSGIIVRAGDRRPAFEVTRRRLVWQSGAVAHVFSSEDPESLRGPQFAAAWCDEFAKWRYPQECWDMLQFGLRLGDWPRQLVTTTPRPIPALRRMIDEPSTFLRRMRTAENADNLAPGFMEAMAARYAGTRLGRQELEGELILDRADALWSRNMFERPSRIGRDMLRRIVIAIDPPATSKATSDACGIIAAGIDDRGVAHVIADHTIGAAQPSVWAARATGLFHALEADLIVAETNQGGDMVASVLRAIDPAVPIKSVRAKRGKWSRAEPVSALYEQGRVRHARPLPELEDEMCDFGPDGLSSGRSPDRVDALVWAIGELLLRERGAPRVRPVD